MDSDKQRIEDAIRKLAEERAKLQSTIDGAEESMGEIDRTLAALQGQKAAIGKKPPDGKKT